MTREPPCIQTPLPPLYEFRHSTLKYEARIIIETYDRILSGPIPAENLLQYRVTSLIASLAASQIELTMVELGSGVSSITENWCARLAMSAALFGKSKRYVHYINNEVLLYAQRCPASVFSNPSAKAEFLAVHAAPGTPADALWFTFAAAAFRVQILLVHDFRDPSPIRFGDPFAPVVLLVYGGETAHVVPLLCSTARQDRITYDECDNERFSLSQRMTTSLDVAKAIRQSPNLGWSQATSLARSTRLESMSRRGLSTRGRGRGRGIRPLITCFRCQGQGHMAKECTAAAPVAAPVDQ